jgi:hypothetical protein
VFDLLQGVFAHEDMDICSKTSLAALNTASFPVDDLLHAIREIILPGLGDIFRVLEGEELVDGVDAGSWLARHSHSSTHPPLTSS